MPPEKKNLRSAHPGVWILKSPWRVKGKGSDKGKIWEGVAYRGKWKNPNSGRWEWLTLGRAEFPTKEARVLWARDQSEKVQKRLAELRAGSIRTQDITLTAAIDKYLASCRDQLRPRTVKGYAMSLGFLSRWAERVGVRTAADLTEVTLVQFADAVKSGDALQPKKKTKRSPGKTRAPSPTYVNNTYRAVSTFCRWLRRHRYTAALNRDQVAEALENAPTKVDLPHPLSMKDCRRLLEAAIRHDAATFKITRTEHAAESTESEVARTPRHRPFGSFICFLLLSGCRCEEARTLRWKYIDFDAKALEGRADGEILLPASGVKTRKERAVAFAETPTLRSLLLALRVGSGGEEFVFGGDRPLSSTVVQKGRRRLMEKYGAPEFTAQRLRQTAASYLHSAPNIYPGDGDFHAAERLGHSRDVARRLYVDRIKNIPETATTLEVAMTIEDLVLKVVMRVSMKESQDFEREVQAG